MKKQLSDIYKGFTLVELLVVIAIVAILAAAVIIGIDPTDKINAANDSKVQNDIASIATAGITYSTSNSGFFAAAITDLTASGDLKLSPTAPTGYSAYVYTASPALCTAGVSCTSFTITGQLKAKKWGTKLVQKFESATGKTCQVVLVGDPCL